MKFRQTFRGFTLIEIALVVVIASVLLMAGVRLMIARAESAQIEATRKNQDAIKTALISYLGQTKRLPCPDSNLDGVENRDTPNPAPCNAYVGTVPYVTLGLDRSAVLDGWDNYIAYVVSPNPSTPLPSPPQGGSPNWSTAWLYTFVQPPQPITDPTTQTNVVGSAVGSAFWPTVSTGAIVVNDVNGNPISTPASIPPTGAVVVLISYGKNGYGATNVSGGQNNPAGAGQDELINISPVLNPGQIVVVNRDITDQIVLNHGAFDDIVLPLRQNDLVAPLVTSGTFQVTPVLGLNQANDYVIGQIAASRTQCPVTPVCGSCASPSYSYTVPSTGNITFPSNWPVTYVSTGPCIASSGLVAGNPAYTLNSSDGNSRTVTIGEVIGILGRVSGF